MKNLKHFLIVAMVSIAGTGIVRAQSADQSAAIKKITDGKTFEFKPQTAELNNNDAVANGDFNAASSNHIPLKGDFMVTVKPDSVASTLPYFDDAQTPDQPVNAAGDVAVTLNEKATKFCSKQYDYAVQDKKKGEVEVTLTPKDNKDIRKFTFDIDPDGKTKLVVNVGSIKRIIYEGSLVM